MFNGALLEQSYKSHKKSVLYFKIYIVKGQAEGQKPDKYIISDNRETNGQTFFSLLSFSIHKNRQCMAHIQRTQQRRKKAQCIQHLPYNIRQHKKYVMYRLCSN